MLVNRFAFFRSVQALATPLPRRHLFKKGGHTHLLYIYTYFIHSIHFPPILYNSSDFLNFL